MKCLSILFLLFISSVDILAQSDTVVVKDFAKDWMFFDSEKKLPLVKKSDFEGNTVHFYVDQSTLQNSYLSIDYPFEFSVFINGQLFKTAVGNALFSIEDQKAISSRAEIIIYSNKLNPYLLNTTSLKIIDTSLDPLQEDVVLVNPRNREVFTNFYLLSIIGLLIYFTIIATYSGRSIAEYFKIERALSPRELDENLLKTRIFTGANVTIYLFICLLIAHLIMSTVYLSGAFPERELFYPSSVMDAIGNWLRLSFVLLTGLFLKYLLLQLASSLFQVRDFLNSHFYNFLRLSLMIALALSVITGIVYYSIYNYQNEIYSAFYQIMLLASLPVIFILYLKLMNASSYKNLHLFSYLCATELIPFVVILSFGIN